MQVNEVSRLRLYFYSSKKARNMTVASTKVTSIGSRRPAPPAVPQAPHSVEADAVDATQRNSYAVTALAEIIDRSVHAAAARFTVGVSPAALAHAYLDWATHLAFSPGKRLQLDRQSCKESHSVRQLRSIIVPARPKRVRLASSRSRKTGGLRARLGTSGPTISSIRLPA